MTQPTPMPDEAVPPPPERRASRGSWLAAIALAQVALVVFLAAWLLDRGAIGIPGAWAWVVRSKPVAWLAIGRVVAVGLTILVVGVVGRERIRARRKSDAAVVAALVILTFALQLAVAGLAPSATFLLIAATASDISTEYFSVAWEMVDLGEFLRDYPMEMTESGHHVATHPPGAVLFYWACIRFYQGPLFPRASFDRLTEIVVGVPRDDIAASVRRFPGVSLASEAVGPALFCCLVLGGCAALSLLPLYCLARRAGRRTTALTVCTLFAIAPAPVLFFQGLDSLLLLIAVTAAALMLSALQSDSRVRAALAGAVVGAGLLVSFGAGAAGATVGLLAALWALRERRDAARSDWRALGAFAAGAALVVLAGHVACGMTLHVVFRQGMAAHRGFTWIGFRRAYWPWVALNLAGLASLIVLDLSGSVRGEVGRVWLLMMPPLVLWAGHWLCSAAPDKRVLAALTAGLTLAQLVLLGATLTPVVMPF
jgi:hypothetical protein